MALCGGAGLVLRIFLALLPILLRLMGRVQGLYSESMLDYSVVTKYYIFQARGLGGGLGSVGFLYMYSQSMLDFSVVTKYYIFQARAAVPSIPQPVLLAGIERLQTPSQPAGYVHDTPIQPPLRVLQSSEFTVHGLGL